MAGLPKLDNVAPSFSISNLGMMGVENFDAVINPPQASILAVGSAVKRPVIDAKGEINVGRVMCVNLSADHRVIDGAVGALFINSIVEYLSHPLRIATMLMNFLENFNEEQINLALLHNIYEVSNVNKKIISNKFGIKMAEDIEILTVRRELQWNIEYKKAYYKKIYNACLNVGQIKSLDKFDNIFTICLNPDDEIRIKYIDEIKQFVLPLVKKTLPILYKDFSNCCSEAENLGYSPIR